MSKMQSIIQVNSEPFIMLAGEVHNSNSSSVEVMEPIWQKAENLGMNTLLLPVTWEMLEPAEGEFDFTLVDGLIRQARGYGCIFVSCGLVHGKMHSAIMHQNG